MHIFKRRLTWVLSPIVAAICVVAGVTAVSADSATLAVGTSSLPAGEIGSPYSQMLTATGGTVPYTWSITAGALPAGLALNGTTGGVTGTPTASGDSSFTAQVADSAGHTATAALSITIQNAVNVTTASMPAGQVGAAYSATLMAADGVTPYTWSLANSTALPAGLSLAASTGVISGTPTAAGSVDFIAEVTDSLGHSATHPLTIAVNPGLEVATTSLPDGVVGAAYSQTLTETGGTAPFSWSVSVGSLPAGLTLDGTSGVISGTPTTTGTVNFTAQVSDSAGHNASQALSITVDAAPTLAVTTASLPNGKVGAAYSQTVSASGGTAPYSWMVAAGSLPDGLSFSTAGVVSGTPTTAGTSTFTAKVTDSTGAMATKDFSITIDNGVVTTGNGHDNLVDQVTAVCQAKAGQKPFDQLCDVFFNFPLTPSIQNALGHIILKLNGSNDGDNDKDDQPKPMPPVKLTDKDDQGSHDGDDHHVAPPAKATVSAGVKLNFKDNAKLTPTPAPHSSDKDKAAKDKDKAHH